MLKVDIRNDCVAEKDVNENIEICYITIAAMLS